MFGFGGGRYAEDGYYNGHPKNFNPKAVPPGGSMYSNWGGSGFAPPPPPPARVSCGELRSRDIGRTVEMAGRLHKLSRDRFVQLKDPEGMTQLVVPMERTDLQRRFQRMPLNSFVAVMGEVNRRPNCGHNEKMSTGEIEVIVEDILMVKVNKMDHRPKPQMMGMSREPSSDDNPPKITSEEYHKFHGLLQQLNERKYTCGDLCHKVNQGVSLVCWVEKSSKKFITLMDGYGKIQAVVPSNRDEIAAIADNLTPQAVVVVAGKVTNRPTSQINQSAVNGHIELQIETLDWPMFDLHAIQESETLESLPEEVTNVNKLTGRTHTCGELRAAHAGQRVVLCGRLQFLRLCKFVLLRDAYGVTQCVLSQPIPDNDLSQIPLESVLKVDGMVAMRPPSMVNEDLITGEVEVVIKSLVVLSAAKTVPFKVNTSEKPDEKQRLIFRHVDLRSKAMQNNLRLRSSLLHNMRTFLVDRHLFVEVDTPTLSAKPFAESTALNVLSSKGDGQKYSLVAEPLFYSQLLMAGDVDRYFQIARYYSSEPTEGQAEVTRLHVAMCYTDRDNFLHLLEQLLRATLPARAAPPPYARLTHRDALRTYGTHTPDASYDLKFRNLSEVMDKTHDEENFGAYAVIYPNKVRPFTPNMKQRLASMKDKNTKVHIVFDLNELKPAVEKKLRQHMNLDSATSYILAYGDSDESCLQLGEIRSLVAEELSAKQLLHRSASLTPLWIVDAPMFAGGGGGGGGGAYRASCAAFAAPHPDDVDLLHQHPEKLNEAVQYKEGPGLAPVAAFEVRAMAYSLVMNGRRLAEGCVRCNEPEQLRRQLALTDVEPAAAAALVAALDTACPPHAEISIDMDEIVAVACSAETIREVIAFPKSAAGEDLLFTEPPNVTADEISEPSAKVKRVI